MLSGRQKRHLRAIGHHLDPIVQVGKDGITEGLLAATDQTLLRHELIKVRLSEAAGDDRRAVAAAIAEATGAEVAQVLGRTFLLYRAHPDEPTIALPA